MPTRGGWVGQPGVVGWGNQGWLGGAAARFLNNTNGRECS